jgi:hypothetical protein
MTLQVGIGQRREEVSEAGGVDQHHWRPLSSSPVGELHATDEGNLHDGILACSAS